MKIPFAALLVVLCFAASSYAKGPIDNSYFKRLQLDRIIAIRILILPKGDHFAADVRTFVSQDPEHIQAIEENIKKLPATGPLRRSAITRPKSDVRRVVLVNSDRREVSLMVHGDQLEEFGNEGPAAVIISTIKSIERSSDRALAKMDRLPVIDAVVTHYYGGRFPNAGANLIRVGDRVQFDLSKLTRDKPSAHLHFSSKDEPNRRGWLISFSDVV